MDIILPALEFLIEVANAIIVGAVSGILVAMANLKKTKSAISKMYFLKKQDSGLGKLPNLIPDSN